MPDIVTFDPDNLRIIEIDTGTDNLLNITEIYSEWKQFLLDDPSRLQYPQAFRYIGSDPISETQNAGTTFFIMNGWRIRPCERNHTLTINGNIYTEGTGVGDFPDVITLGSFNVRIRYLVSNLVDAIVSRVDAALLDSLTRQQKGLQYLVETRGGKMNAGTGDVFYFDPINGDDAHDGTSNTGDGGLVGPVQTLTAALALCTAGDNDVVQIVQTTANYTHYENISITKSGVQIRGPGRTFVLSPVSPDVPTISISATCALHGFTVEGTGSGTASLIDIANSSSNVQLYGLDVENSPVHGIVIGASCRYLRINDVDTHSHAGSGIVIGRSRATLIENTQSHSNGGNGITCTLEGGGAFHAMPEIRGCNIHGNSGYGILIPATYTKALITGSTAIFGNTLGDLVSAEPDMVAESLVEVQARTKIMERNQKGLQYLVETDSGRIHAGTGTIFYFDPISGNDAYNGLSNYWESGVIGPVRTLTAAIALCVSGRKDVINIVQSTPNYTHYENVLLDKSGVHIRGPTRGFSLVGAIDSAPVLRITAHSTLLSGFTVRGAGTGTANTVEVADGCLHVQFYGIGINNSAGHGLLIGDGCDLLLALEVNISYCAGDGMVVGLSSGISVQTAQIYQNVGNGITFAPVAGGAFNSAFDLRACNIHANTGYGIYVPADYHRVAISSGTLVFENTLGDTHLEGQVVVESLSEVAASSKLAAALAAAG